MKIIWLVALSIGTAILAVAGGAYLWPTMRADLRQDDCAFGPVSNAQYIAMLAQARTAKWPPINWGDGEQDRAVSVQIQHRINDMLVNEKNFPAKVSAMHATMRSMGGVYRATLLIPNKGSMEFFDNQTLNEAAQIKYGYYLDADRYLPVSLTRSRWIAIYVTYHIVSSSGKAAGTFDVHAYMPRLIDSLHIQTSPKGEPCPIVPEF